jgi:hypothetical protein
MTGPGDSGVAGAVESPETAKWTVVASLFGAALQPQGRGYYVTLELFAIARGVARFEECRPFMDEPKWGQISTQTLLDPDSDQIVHLREPQDFIRRLIFDPAAEFLRSDRHPCHDLADQLPAGRVLKAVAELMAGLTVPVPYIDANDWYKSHLFPYEGNLVHYDAQQRRDKETGDFVPTLERDRFRGGGLLAYDILRTDDDSARRERIAQALDALVADSSGPLGQTASVLEKFNELKSSPLVEKFEVADRPRRERSVFAGELRSGVDKILHLDVGRARKIQYLMQWIPLVVALHQRELCYRELAGDNVPDGRVAPPILLAFDDSPMLRGVSRAALGETRRAVVRALDQNLERLAGGENGRISLLALDKIQAEKDSTWREQPGGFFVNTMAAVGALNHNTGSRYFTLRPTLLEAVVAATLGSAGLSFKEFTDEVLDMRFGLLASRRSCEAATLARPVDGGRAERNERELERLLLDCGLLDQLSDSNSVVCLPGENQK